MEKFEEVRRFGIVVQTNNLRCIAGKAQLFSNKGPTIFFYHNEAPADGWALKRVWYFGLFSVIHIGPGKSTSKNGWYLSFFKISLKKDRQSLILKWEKPVIYQSIPAPKRRTSDFRKKLFHG